MTTAPPIAYSPMEVPIMDDSMEMASPYQGQADDFDIDIDLMEDNVSNMDSDMMGADEFTNNSQHNEPNNDAIYDADMADEPSEGSMIDADNYADEDNDIDVQIEEELYEEEMIETDPVEEVDRAIPSIHIEPTTSNEHAASPIREDPALTTAEPLEAAPQGSSDFVEIPTFKTDAPASEVEDSHTQAEPSKADNDLTEEPSKNVDDIKTKGPNEDSEIGEQADEIPQASVSETETKTIPDEGPEVDQVENPTLGSQVDATGHPEAEPVSEENQQAASQDESLHQITYADEPLHPVKILYQNCEIALFPPLEGDSAETFFLQDEDVAYDNIGQLFKHFRQVLDKTLGKDVLVIDIDTLGIQITEDSSYTSQVTLYQILDLYLRLCRNDGTNEPDALYLTLSRKRAFSDEILDLNAAAIAGKTLSELQAEIHSWNEYDEPEPGSEGDLEAHGAEEHEDEIYYTNEAQNEHSTIEGDTASGHEADASDQSQFQAQNVSDVQQNIVHVPDEDTSVSVEKGVEVVPEPESASSGPQRESIETGQPEEPRNRATEQTHQHDHVDDDTIEEHYDSEGPQSDSTATIAGLVVDNGITQDSQDVSPEIVHAGTHQSDQKHHYAEADPENTDLGPDEHHEDYVAPLDNLESSHNETTGIENDDIETQEPADPAPVLSEEEEDELDAPPTNEIVSSATVLQDSTIDPSRGQTASSPDSGLQVTYDKAQTPEPADDLLGIAEDLLQTPPRDTEHHGSDHFEGVDYEGPEDEPAAPVAADDEGVNDHEFDETHFGDYETQFEASETVELVEEDHSLAGSPDKNASAKRSREDEDHWDEVETTVDTKRRRSS